MSRLAKAIMISLLVFVGAPSLAEEQCPSFAQNTVDQLLESIRQSQLTDLRSLLTRIEGECQARYSPQQQILLDTGRLFLATHTFPDKPTTLYSDKLLSQNIDLLPESQRVLAYAVAAEHFLIFGEFKAAVTLAYIITNELSGYITDADGVYTYITISNIFDIIGYTTIAEDYARRAAALADAPMVQIRTLIPLYRSANITDKQQVADQLNEFTTALPPSMNRAEGWFVLGLQAIDDSNIIQARDYLASALKDARQATADRLYVAILIVQAELAISNDDRDTADQLIGTINQYPVDEFEASEQLRFATVNGQVAADNGLNERALHFTRQQLALTSAIHNNINDAIIANALARFKVNESEKELALVKKQQQVQALQNKQQKQLMWIYILGLVSTLLLLLLVSVLFWQKRKRAAHYKQLANRDALTQTLNRRAIEEVAQTEFQQASSDNTVVIALADIDHFKSINDEYGHDAGDEVLRQFARHARSVMRKSDYLGRWGGEEWLMVFPDTQLSAMPQFFARLQQALQHIQIDDQSLAVTFSMGAVTNNQFASFDKAVSGADKLMYDAKKDGRNGLRCAD